MGEKQHHAKRGKSFTNSQDIAICNAWLAMIQDPIVGTLQRSDNFWGRVSENYAKNADDQSVRSSTSIQSRWGIIMRSCKKFHECLSQIENKQQNGMTKGDAILQAKLLYIELEKKKFPFDHCWEILRKSSKWQDLPIRRKRVSKSSAVGDFPHISSAPSEILETQKSQKKSKLVGNSSSSLCDLMSCFEKQPSESDTRKALAEERRLQILEEANERERRKAEVELKIMMDKNDREQKERDDRIMMMDTSNMDSRTRAYYEHRKAEIFEKSVRSTSSTNGAVPLLPFSLQD